MGIHMRLTHKKNSSVTMVNGHKLWRKVRLAALVTLLLSTRRLERFFRICLKPMVAVHSVSNDNVLEECSRRDQGYERVQERLAGTRYIIDFPCEGRGIDTHASCLVLSRGIEIACDTACRLH